MTKLQYEKNETIKILKNEIYGINQLLDILEKIEEFDFSDFDGKIINIKLERALREFTNDYISIERKYAGYEMRLLIKDRYNEDTKAYVDFYNEYSIKVETIITFNTSGKSQTRLDYFSTNLNIKKAISNLNKMLLKLEDELLNIDNIVDEIIQLNNKVLEFKEGKSSFLLESFKSIRNYY